MRRSVSSYSCSYNNVPDNYCDYPVSFPDIELLVMSRSEVTFVCPLAGKVTSGALMVGSFSCLACGASWRGGCGQEGKWAVRPSPSAPCVAMVMGVHLW